jgi:glycosyltransferase involved in cell wall biosynthesis
MKSEAEPAAPIKIGVIGAKGVGGVQGGIETYCSYFYRHLTPGKFHVTLFVPRRGEHEASAGAQAIVRIRVPKLVWLEMPLVAFVAVLSARIRGIRTLHVHGIGASICLPLARLLGLRVIVRYLGPEYTTTKWGRLGRLTLRICERFVARFADRVVCLTPHLAEQFARLTGRTHHVFVVPNGVARPASESSINPRIDEIIGAKRPFVLSVGRIVAPKNFHVLIEAFLASDLPRDAILAIAGDIDFRGHYGELINRLTAEQPRVVLLGPIFGANLWRLYRHCRLYVLPSMHEGMSFSLLEAGLAGANIIASEIPANTTVCQGFGRLIPVNSVTALAAAMEEEWDRARSRASVRRQIEWCRSQHHWKEICRQMEPILALATHGRAQSGSASRVLERTPV